MSVRVYETNNSTYAVDGMWIRAARGGNDHLDDKWRRAEVIQDTGIVLVVKFIDGTGFVSSRIRNRVPS